MQIQDGFASPFGKVDVSNEVYYSLAALKS